MSPFRKNVGGLVIALKITPRARREGVKGVVVGLDGPALALGIAAPPSEGRANEALRRFLAKRWGVATSAITIESGAGARHKRILVAGNGEALLESISAIEGLGTVACAGDGPASGERRR